MYRATSYLARQGRSRCLWSVAALVAGPVQETALHVSMRCGSVACSHATPLVALTTAKRYQATSSDKKFHCSVCKKPFRLERAAQVHITQSHGGDGTVEAGPGPGFAEPTKPSSALSGGGFGAPPTGPTIVTQQRDPHSSVDDDDEDYPRGKMRPTPKPLHQPTQDVPEDAMVELLGVWDSIGTKRLEDGFVHSSMVMKVFAGRRVDAKDLPPSYQVDVPQPTGENPFEAALTKRASDDKAAAAETVVDDDALGGVDIGGPFALAPAVGRGPFCPAAVSNPLQSGAVKKLAVPSEPIRKVATPKVDVQAPVTPFGQLPMFGQPSTLPKKEADPAPLTSSPFAIASSASASPFAAAASPPTGGSSQAPGAVASPFAAAAASPFAASVSSPFASAASPFTLGASASPFTAAVGTSTPQGDTSPFTAPSPFAASPFAAAHDASMPTPDMNAPFQPLPSDDVAEGAASARDEKKLTCALCGKAFRNEFDMGQHSRQKHNIDVPSEQRKPLGKAKRMLPDLPAYVPSPVDLAATSPFGSSSPSVSSWAETPLVLHGHSVSNMTLMGTVLDVDVAVKGAVHLSVAIPGGGGDAGSEEVVTVRCLGDAKDFATANVKRNLNVLVTGSLRLVPQHEAALNKYFLNPVVHVSAPTGSIFLVD